MIQNYKKNDDKVTEKQDRKIINRLLEYIKPYKKYVVFAIIINILLAIINPLRPFLSKIAIDDYITKYNFKGLIILCIILLGSIVFQSLLQYFLNYYTQFIGQKIIYDIRCKLFKHTQSLSLRFFDNTPIGRMVTRVTNDIESLNDLFSSGIVQVFSDISLVIWIFAFMFYMDWKLAVVALSVLPILIYTSFIFKKKARESFSDVRLHLARLNSYMQEHILGMNIVQLFNKENDELKSFKAINKDHTTANVKSVFYYATFYPFVEFLSSLAITITIWYAAGDIIGKKITIGVLFAFIQYTEMFFRPIRDISEKYNILQTAIAASERIFKLFDENDTDPINNIGNNNIEIKGSIEFKNVWFAYNEGDWILKDVSFKINAGQTIAFVGHTGAGKTTIISLILRYYEIQKGEILIDGINIKDLNLKFLRDQISIVLQDVHLFSGTIKSNIDLGNEHISDELIQSCSELVGASNFIEKLDNKYTETVKERGASLSVGQKQLITFARALAHQPKILVLDEATSSVDTETEQLLQNAIHNLLENKTSIVIAHRLSTIQNADKIIVLHKGELKEEGNHLELVEKHGLYYKLYQLQYNIK